MRFTGIRFQEESGIDRRLRQIQAARRVIKVAEVELIVRLSQPAIGEKKRGIARDRLIKQFYSLGILVSLLLMFLSIRAIDQRARLDV